MNNSPTIDPNEVQRFDSIAQQWWDPNGPFGPLHKLNPTRLTYIRDQICQNFERDAKAPAPLEALTILDIGCGGRPGVRTAVPPRRQRNGY